MIAEKSLYEYACEIRKMYPRGRRVKVQVNSRNPFFGTVVGYGSISQSPMCVRVIKDGTASASTYHIHFVQPTDLKLPESLTPVPIGVFI